MRSIHPREHHEDEHALPRFQQAAAHARILLPLIAACAAFAIGLLALLPFVADLDATRAVVWRALVANSAATSLLLLAGLLGAYWRARWRAQSLTPRRELGASGVASTRLRRALARLRGWSASAVRRIGLDTLRAGSLGILALLAFVNAFGTLDFQIVPVPLERAGFVIGGALLLLAFCTLVLERYFAREPATIWPESPHLALFTRLVILTLLLQAAAAFFASDTRTWPFRAVALAGVLPTVVAAEIVLRMFFTTFVRGQEAAEPRAFAAAAFVGVLRWPPRPLHALHAELRERFGIDLKQTWAFAFMRRAVLPIAGAIALIGWLATGVREIPFEGRAVHERFGRPVEVWQPGLHFGLPWPMSRVRQVENGVVHEVGVTLPVEEVAEEPSTVDGPPPPSANRLWDRSHVSEKSQVIASASGERQSFEVVYMDVRFIYRIAPTDAAVLAVVYRTEDVAGLIRSTASRVLVRDFAARTLEGVLGESRLALAADIGRAVQADLAALDSGVEILATLIEGVHPPAGAANAYHSVQAAQIKSQATIARERGRMAEQVNAAQLQASLLQDKAHASSREATAHAEAARLRFDAEREGYRKAGRVFVFEQYLTRLARGLTDAEVMILDHRLNGAQSPTIDLRAYGTAGDAVVSLPPE